MVTTAKFDAWESVEPDGRKYCMRSTVAVGDDRSFVGRISTIAVDRDGDVLLPSGVNLKNFKRNPVVLLSHNSGALPIGTCLSIRQESDGLIARGEMASRPPSHPDTAEWVPDTVLHMLRERHVRAFSVGFNVPQGGARIATPDDRKLFGDGTRQVITKWELVEFSVVAVPCNPEALSKSKSFHASWVSSKMYQDEDAFELLRNAVDADNTLDLGSDDLSMLEF